MRTQNEIIRIFDKFVMKYEHVNHELREFNKSSFSISNNIAIFINFHIEFNEKVIEIFNNSITLLLNNQMNRVTINQLKELFISCRKEHNDINDTYNRVQRQNTAEYYEFESIIASLIELVDSIEYYDDIIDLLELI